MYRGTKVTKSRGCKDRAPEGLVNGKQAIAQSRPSHERRRRLLDTANLGGCRFVLYADRSVVSV